MTERALSTELSRSAPSAIRSTLTAAEFRGLAEVPPAAEWFANFDSANTRRFYQNDLQGFMRFVGIFAPAQLRLITRAHMVAWRKDLERRELSGSRSGASSPPFPPCSNTCPRPIRRGVMHLRVRGKGNKLRHVPLHPGSQELLADYPQGETSNALPLFRPVKNP